MWLKWWYTFIISMFVISAAYGSSCLSGGLSTVNNKYHVLTGSFYFNSFLNGYWVLCWSFALGPNVRRIWKTHLLYIIRFVRHFQHPLCLVSKYWRIIGLPFLVWCFASSALSIAGASLVDMHNDTRGLALSFFSFCPYSGPVISLIVNGFIATDTERMDLIIWVNMAFAGVMWIMVRFNARNLCSSYLEKKSQKLRKEQETTR